jgi:hypothetical protein
MNTDEPKVKWFSTKGFSGLLAKLTSPFTTPSPASSGEALQAAPDSEPSAFKPRRGHDFSQIRVQTDGRKSDLARDLYTQALTLKKSEIVGRN